MKKRLNATTRSAARRDMMDDDYEEAEPNMRLSRAFVVVLVLHIVAVGGIVLFNKLQTAPPFAASASASASATPSPTPAPMPVPGHSANAVPVRRTEGPVAASAPVKVTRPTVQPASAPARITPASVKSTAVPPIPVKVATAVSAPGGQTYTVAKGDNPYSIAHKFKLREDQLLKANNITDPRKLQIGQVLTIPSSGN